MIVYVESNFLLEIAALQEEHEQCTELLRLAEEEEIRLVVPSFAIAEPIHTIHRRHSERAQLQRRLTREIGLLSRSASFQERLREIGDVASILHESRQEEQRALDEVLERAAGVGELIPLNKDVLNRARGVRDEHGLSQPDAIILASVLYHLRTAPDERRCFLQRDRKDFRSPDIETELEALDCELLPGFDAGLGYVRAVLES